MCICLCFVLFCFGFVFRFVQAHSLFFLSRSLLCIMEIESVMSKLLFFFCIYVYTRACCAQQSLKKNYGKKKFVRESISHHHSSLPHPQNPHHQPASLLTPPTTPAAGSSHTHTHTHNHKIVLQDTITINNHTQHTSHRISHNFHTRAHHGHVPLDQRQGWLRHALHPHQPPPAAGCGAPPSPTRR